MKITLRVISVFILFALGSYAFASSCQGAYPDYSDKFCHSFKKAAECYCTSAGVPRIMCTDMSLIYSRMLAIYGTVESACKHQKDTDYQTCLDDWHCYRSGGSDSKEQLCSGTGKSCE